MKTKMTIAMVAAIGALALAANAQDNTPPADGSPADGQAPAQHAGGAGRPQPGYHLLPPPLVQQMKLTDDQKTQIAALEADTKTKLEKILTADQLTQLKNFRPPGRPGGQGGGQMRGEPGGGQGRNFGGNGPGGDDGGMPPGPPPGDN